MELSISDLREMLGGTTDNGELPFHIGQKLFIRTVTYHITGEVAAIGGGFLTLEDAAWIADSGRFADALAKSDFSEVEPFARPVYVAISAITDATEIDQLPRKQK